jgi:exonuclease SbcC
MNLKLLSLHIKNFKGIKEMDVSFSQELTNIYGENASGKTTLADAFHWLLFNKNSQGIEKFDIRPLDVQGAVIHNIEINVSASLEVDGVSILLSKTQKQNWVKSRGSESKELKGNVNTYEINEIPVLEKDFKARVESLISERLFKMITSPTAFASLPWKEQRSILFELVSGSNVNKILLSDKKYDVIAKDLEKFTAEDLTAKASKALKELKSKQEELPARIDELNHSLVEVDVASLERDKADIKSKITDIETQEESVLASFNTYDEIYKQIHRLKEQQQKEIDKGKQDFNSKKEGLQEELDRQTQVFSDAFRNHSRFERDIEDIKKEIQLKKESISQLRQDYVNLSEKKIDEHSMFCPACKQAYPDGRREEILSDFNTNKQAHLLQIQEKGKQGNLDIKNLEAEISELKKKIETAKQEKIASNKRKSELTEQLTVLCDTPIPYPEAVLKMQEEIDSLTDSLKATDNQDNHRQKLKEEKEFLKGELLAIEKQLASTAFNNGIKARIEELEKELKEIAQLIADQEKILFALEEYTRAKMEVLSDSINKHFKLVNFKLFNIQVNGGIKKTCECTMNGVPFSALNSAGKIQAGIDIINTLTGIYDVSAPIWIDNRETCTQIPVINSQIINLYVSEQDKEIRVEEGK